MKNQFIPTYVFSSIYEITPALMLQNGVRGILIDLDGTMASRHAPKPSEQVGPFLQSFVQAGIAVLVLSNNKAERVQLFCEELGVPHLHRAYKPSKDGFLRGAKQLGLPIGQCAVIGDQIYTDTFGGNRAGAAMTCYVNSIDHRDFIIHLRYQLERGFIAYGKKQMETRRKTNGS